MSMLSPFAIPGSRGYDNPYSLLMDGAAHYLSRTPGSDTSATRTATIFVILHRWKLGTQQTIIEAATPAGALDKVEFTSGDKISVRLENGGDVSTDAVFRDTIKPYFIRIDFDLNNATAADRIKITVNKVLQTVTGTSATSANFARFKGLYAHKIGDSVYSAGTGYACFNINTFILVDGSNPDVDAFDRFDAVSGQPVPVNYRLAVSGNSFRLRFRDGTSTTTLGEDDSGNGNDWTLNSMATADRLTDSPANCHAILNALGTGGASPTEGGLGILNNAANWEGLISTLAVADFPIYAEMTCGTMDASERWNAFGLKPATENVAANDYPGLSANSHGILVRSGPSANHYYYNNGAPVATYGTVPSSGQVMQIAFDPTSGKLWFGRANVWYNSGNPETGANPVAMLSTSIKWMFMAAAYNNTLTVNFGQRPFTYTPPTGFKALNTRNLPTPSIRKASNAFVTKLDTEANIFTSLAALRSGWSGYVDIYKNRANSESWAWKFSHDASNEYAVSASTSTRQATRAMSGSDNWVGFSFRVGSTYGTAAGSVSHTNGVATTVTHNLNKSRCAIFLFKRTGSLALVYHPDLTAGELLDLTSTAGDAANTTITSVGANSFQIGSGAATDTYDYFVLGETDGFCSLSKYTGNGNADGPMDWNGLRPVWSVIKDLDSAAGFYVGDAARNTYNPVVNNLAMNLANVESTTNYALDHVAGGKKIRTTDTNINRSGSRFACITIGNPVKTATAA